MYVLLHTKILLYGCLFFTLVACKQDSKHQTIPSQVADTAVNVKRIENTDNLSIAPYERNDKDRVIWQKPDVVIQKLGNLEGKTVVDIGAGTGYFAFRMVTKANKVIAVDIDKRAIDFMDSIKVQLPPAFQMRFETRLAEPHNAHLKPEEADAVVIVNTYSYLKNRTTYLENLRHGMAKNAKILIIDFKKKITPIGPPLTERIAMDVIEQELLLAGYRKINTDDTTLDYQYIVMAIKN